MNSPHCRWPFRLALLIVALLSTSAARADLVHYWNFDEASGDAIDSVAGADGTLGSAVTRVSGIIGSGALDFDNTTNSRVTLPSSGFIFTTGVTLEALILPTWTGSGGDYDEIFRKDDGNNRILFSFQNDSFNGGAQIPVAAGPVLSFGLNTGGYGELDLPLNTDLTLLAGGNAGSGTIYLTDPGGSLGANDVVLRDGELHHVAATYDAATGVKSIYIDGSLRWSFTVAGTPNILSGGGVAAAIGNLASGGEPFNGVIDEMAIYDAALGSSEIGDHHQQVLAGNNYFTPIPEPGSLALLATVLLAAGAWSFNRRTAGGH